MNWLKKPLRIFLAVCAALQLTGCGPKKLAWTEEVKLQSGEVLLTRRTALARPYGQIGGTGGWENEGMADGSGVTIQNFQSGDLGLHLNDTATTPETSRTIVGDLAPVDFDPNTAGVQSRLDDLDNVIVDATQFRFGGYTPQKPSCRRRRLTAWGNAKNFASLFPKASRNEALQ